LKTSTSDITIPEVLSFAKIVTIVGQKSSHDKRVQLNELINKKIEAIHFSSSNERISERIISTMIILYKLHLYTVNDPFSVQMVDEVNDDVLLRWLNLLLRNLQNKDIFLQDLTIMVICNLYNTSINKLDSDKHYFSPNLNKKIAEEVLMVLCRDKAPHQPPGMAVAGQSSSEQRTAAATRTNNEMNTMIQNLVNNRNDDQLIRAANLLTNQLGVDFHQQDNNTLPPPSQPANNYGIFSTIAKLARKVNLVYYLKFTLYNVVAINRRESIILFSHYFQSLEKTYC
jgi:hypothetical protein